jgi:hypothetical protein
MNYLFPEPWVWLSQNRMAALARRQARNPANASVYPARPATTPTYVGPRLERPS